MERSGYIITPNGAAALSAIAYSGVRFVATLEDGTGFVAFDGDAADAYQLRGITGGRVLVAMEPQPEFIPLCPKRHVGTGAEVFSLVRPIGQVTATARQILEADPDAALAIVSGDQLQGDGDLLILVETQGLPIDGAPREWIRGVRTFSDVRIPVGA